MNKMDDLNPHYRFLNWRCGSGRFERSGLSDIRRGPSIFVDGRTLYGELREGFHIFLSMSGLRDEKGLLVKQRPVYTAWGCSGLEAFSDGEGASFTLHPSVPVSLGLCPGL